MGAPDPLLTLDHRTGGTRPALCPHPHRNHPGPAAQQGGGPTASCLGRAIPDPGQTRPQPASAGFRSGAPHRGQALGVPVGPGRSPRLQGLQPPPRFSACPPGRGCRLGRVGDLAWASSSTGGSARTPLPDACRPQATKEVGAGGRRTWGGDTLTGGGGAVLTVTTEDIRVPSCPCSCRTPVKVINADSQAGKIKQNERNAQGGQGPWFVSHSRGGSAQRGPGPGQWAQGAVVGAQAGPAHARPHEDLDDVVSMPPQDSRDLGPPRPDHPPGQSWPSHPLPRPSIPHPQAWARGPLPP